MVPIEDVYISTAELADIVGVSSQTLLRTSKVRGCPVLRVGRLLKWPRAASLAWLQGQQTRAVA